MNIRSKLKQYLEFCQFRKTLDVKTLKAYRIDLRQFFEFLPSENPQRDEIEKYITELHKKYKQKTVKRKLASIKAFYAFLENEEFISENPFRRIKVKFKEAVVLPRIIPRGEIEKLLNVMYACSKVSGGCEGEDRYWLRDMAIVEMFFATGARVYEVSNLRADCVDIESGLIRIMGKGSKERYVQIGEASVLRLLARYYRANEQAIRESGYFFVSRRGSRFSEQSIRVMLKRYTKLAGIDRNITPHMFRHSFATYLIEEGVDVSCVQQILGHSSIRTTQIYIHVAAKKQAEILRTLHPRNQMRIVGAA